MHYYKFNIADYRKDTSHLSTIEHGIYRQLIDWYYLDEKPIPLETQVVSRRLRLGSELEFLSLQNVLSDFFKEGKTGYIHKRIEVEIKDYHEQAEKNKNNGKLGGRPKKTQSVISGLPNESQNNPNHKPITINHKPNKKATVVARPVEVTEQTWNDWLALRKSKKAAVTETVLLGAIEEANKLGWNLEKFLIEWCTRGSQGLKAEWINSVKPNPADIARVTVPPSKKADEALIKILEDEKKAAPIPDSVREFIAKNRRQT